MGRVFRRRWNWSSWLAISMLAIIAGRMSCTPEAKLSLVPEGLARVINVADDGILHVEPVKTTDSHATVNYRVQLIGLPTKFSPAAVAWLREQFSGKTIRLELDKRRLDANGNCLAYAYSGHTFINAELIRRNFVEYSPYLGDSSRHAKDLKEAEKQSLKKNASGE